MAEAIPLEDNAPEQHAGSRLAEKMTDEIAHLIKEYRANAARMRAQADSVRSPARREQFEQIARQLDHLADYLIPSSAAATQNGQRT